MTENLEAAQRSLHRVRAAIAVEQPFVHEAHRPNRRCMACALVRIAQALDEAAP